jgi:hypothetical protein
LHEERGGVILGLGTRGIYRVVGYTGILGVGKSGSTWETERIVAERGKHRV